MNIDFPALFDEVMAGYTFGEVTDDLAPYRYCFALDRAINTGDDTELQRLLKNCTPPPHPCLPALGVALARLNPKGRRKKRKKLSDFDRFTIILRYQASDKPAKVKIIELAELYATSRSNISKVWEYRKKTFPGLTF